MSQTTATTAAAWPPPQRRIHAGTGGAARSWAALGARRWLQLGLAAVWLLDALLQLQSFMFTKGFGQSLGSGPGNPAFVADPVSWSARIIEAHPAWTNAAFASVQLFLALGIAWRPTVKAALAASVAWSLGVWWLGEGLGGLFNGTADAVTGAPGAVILYALLAVLLWPADADAVRGPAPAPDAGGAAAATRSSGSGVGGPFVAARPAGVLTPRLLWLALWGSFAYFAIQAANRTAQGLHDMVAGMADGEPGWLAALDRNAASLLAGTGAMWSVILAVAFAVIAAGIFLPAPGARVIVALAAVTALIIWVIGQNFGGILAGSATDPNSGILLILFAAAYWPRRR
jgi:hypothetical protein